MYVRVVFKYCGSLGLKGSKQRRRKPFHRRSLAAKGPSGPQTVEAQTSKTNKAQWRIPAPKVSGFCDPGSWIPGLLDTSSKGFCLFGPRLLENMAFGSKLPGFWHSPDLILNFPVFEGYRSNAKLRWVLIEMVIF